MWDVGADRRCPPLPAGGVDVVLSVFTLSALPPNRLATAFANLYACLAPGGALLRDYGRRDLKQLKFAREQRERPAATASTSGTCAATATVVFFGGGSASSAAAGFDVESLAEDHRLVVNRATQTKMRRVWVTGVFRKRRAANGGGAAQALPLALAVCSRRNLAVRARRSSLSKIFLASRFPPSGLCR